MNHKMSWTFKSEINWFSSWCSRMATQHTRNTKLTWGLWLTVLYLPFKFGENWIYGIWVMAPIEGDPSSVVSSGVENKAKKARAIEAQQYIIKVPKNLCSRNWRWEACLQPQQNQCHCSTADLTGPRSSQKISQVKTEGEGRHFYKPSRISVM